MSPIPPFRARRSEFRVSLEEIVDFEEELAGARN